MKIKDIIQVVEKLAPLSFQESYDNAGLQVGNPEKEIKAVLLSLDVTEEVMKEARRKKADLIICHHPVIFGGLKNLTGRNSAQRIIIEAIKNNISIYVSHTNLDSAWEGVNIKLAEKLGLKNISILKPVSGTLKKLITFVPNEQAEKVRFALFNAGAGNIGNYDSCSYNIEGKGTFRAGEGTNPFVGKKDKLHTESEIRIETIFPAHLKNKVVTALLENHPYEEVAYDIYPLENNYSKQGIGALGYLSDSMNGSGFLDYVKQKLQCKHLRYSGVISKPITKVAICGGSGGFLISDAFVSGADAFITGDLKYHQFFESEKQMLLVDAGHFETEKHSIEIFYDLLKNKFPTFAIYFSEVNTNPVNYF